MSDSRISPKTLLPAAGGGAAAGFVTGGVFAGGGYLLSEGTMARGTIGKLMLGGLVGGAIVGAATGAITNGKGLDGEDAQTMFIIGPAGLSAAAAGVAVVGGGLLLGGRSLIKNHSLFNAVGDGFVGGWKLAPKAYGAGALAGIGVAGGLAALPDNREVT